MRLITKILFLIIILSAIIIRLFYLFNADINSDEAIVGLMGKHILEGEFPIYYYGQDYMGALEAYLSAVAFFIFGSSPLILKMVPFFCSILFVITTFFLVKKLADESTGIFAMLFTAIPPYFLTVWSNYAGGGYIETLLFGNLIFILTIKLIISKNKQNLTLVLLGIVCGVSWWVDQLVCYYILSAFICVLIYPNGRKALFEEKMILLKRRLVSQKYHFVKVPMFLGKILSYFILFGIIAVFFNLNCGKFGISTSFVSIYFYKRDSIKLLIGAYLVYLIIFRNRDLYVPKGIVLFLTAFTIGNMPTCIYGLNHVLFTGTDIINIESFAVFFNNYWKIGIPVILGISKSWSLAPIFNMTIQIFIFSSYAFFCFYFLFNILKHIVRCKTYPPIRYSLTIIMFILIPIIFGVSRFGEFIKEPRYVLPLYTVLAIFCSITIVELSKMNLFKILSIFFAVFIISCNVKSNLFNYERKQSGTGNIPINDKRVIDFLLSKGIYYAYADYWIAYKITFESNEKIICATLDWSRYPKYEELVSKQNDPAYIMRSGENTALEKFLDNNSVSYKVENITEYWIYYSIGIPPSQKSKNNQVEQGIKIRPAEWEANTNTNKSNIKDAFDGDLSSRWTTNIAQYPGIFFMIDLKKVYEITKVELTSQNNIYDYPRGCRIEISLDGEHWQIVKDVPKVGLDQFVYPPLNHPFKMYYGWLEFSFDPINAKYVKITQTGNNDANRWWSINEVSIYKSS